VRQQLVIPRVHRLQHLANHPFGGIGKAHPKLLSLTQDGLANPAPTTREISYFLSKSFRTA
jgi:hypothetical protein